MKKEFSSRKEIPVTATSLDDPDDDEEEDPPTAEANPEPEDPKSRGFDASFTAASGRKPVFTQVKDSSSTGCDIL
jgi:hypothetical protein